MTGVISGCQGCDGDRQSDKWEVLRFHPVIKMWLCSECRDEAVDHAKLVQRYLIHYTTRLGARFGLAVWGNERQAREDRDLFAGDGCSARIVKLTVVDGQPVAEWVE